MCTWNGYPLLCRVDGVRGLAHRNATLEQNPETERAETTHYKDMMLKALDMQQERDDENKTLKELNLSSNKLRGSCVTSVC